MITFNFCYLKEKIKNRQENGKNERGYSELKTIANHLPEGVELTGEEQEQLNSYIQLLLSKRKK